MMQSLNSGLSGKFLKLVLVLFLFGATAGLVVSDVGGFFRSGGVSNNDVASVGDKKIGLNDFAQKMRATLMRAGISDEQARQMGLPFMVLQQEVTQSVLRQAAHQSGIRVSNRHVATELKKQLASVPVTGTDKEKLDMLLQQQGVTEGEFVNSLRDSFALDILSGTVATSDQQVPAVLSLAGQRYINQKRSAVLVRVNEARLPKEPVLDEAKIASYYKENIARYRTPEKRDIAFIVLPQKNLIPDVSVSDADAKTYFNEHQNQFMNPERVRLSQLIVADEAAAKEIAKQKPASLENFKKDGVDYLASDWYAKPMLNKGLQEALYPGNRTGLTGPVKTEMGWHILLVEKFEDQTPKNFTEVKDVIMRELKDRQIDEKMGGLTEQLENDLSSASNLEAIASDHKVPLQKLADLTPENAVKHMQDAGVAENVIARLAEAAFSLDENEISPIMDTKDGDMVMAQVTKQTPVATPKLEQVKDRVRADAMAQARRDAVDDLANQVIRSFDAKKADAWNGSISSLGLHGENLMPITRAEAEKQLGKDVSNLLFNLTPENPLSSIPDEKGTLIIKLQQIVTFSGDLDAAEVEKTNARIKNETTQELQQQFVEAWRNDLGVKVNDRLMQQYFMQAPTE
jgi:peptidyl-prolyl cis-trans isomerase D